MESDPTPADQPTPPAPSQFGGSPASLRTFDSAELFRGAREVQIRHDEKIYRLQVTRNGKLILIK
jgi:hemin uptake protein HemP